MFFATAPCKFSSHFSVLLDETLRRRFVALILHFKNFGEQLADDIMVFVVVNVKSLGLRMEARSPLLCYSRQDYAVSHAEAPALTNLSRTRLRRAIEEKKPRARIIGRAWRVKRGDLEAYVRKL